jgi:hypothetical protein
MMQKANVLIIEKDPDVGLILKEIVNREVHHISMTIGTADDVLAAEKMLSLQDYDVVVLGSGLGEAGWLALLRKITAEDNHPRGNYPIGQRKRSMCLCVEDFNKDSRGRWGRDFRRLHAGHLVRADRRSLQGRGGSTAHCMRKNERLMIS